jgi:hypothetical protein
VRALVCFGLDGAASLYGPDDDGAGLAFDDDDGAVDPAQEAAVGTAQE